MKNLIIGGSFGYNIEQIRNWVESINRTIPLEAADRAIVVGDTASDVVRWLESKHFTVIQVDKSNLAPHVARFIFIYDYLCSRYKSYKYVVTTDVRDVIFQSNPFEWLDNNLLPTKKLVAGSEGLLYKDEPWGNMNLYETYGQYVYDRFKDNEIFNVGVLGGTAEYIKDLVFNIVTNSVNRPVPIVDQAVFNVLSQTQPYKDIIQFTPHDSTWACQLGTTADPNKIEYFRTRLICAEPIYRDGVVYNSRNEMYCIVHQYDRVPAWKM